MPSPPLISEALHRSLIQADDPIKQELVAKLGQLLDQASMVEHLLAMQYLFSAFSMKKYPEEFDDYRPGDTSPAQAQINQKRLTQIEQLRRWEAQSLYVARQEMTHLALVQNMNAILDREPFFFRPNFPIPPEAFPLGKPLNLSPFSLHTMEIFRYWEKPGHLILPDPFRLKEVPKAIKRLAKEVKHPKQYEPLEEEAIYQKANKNLIDFLQGKAKPDPIPAKGSMEFTSTVSSIEELYTLIKFFFYILFKYDIIEGKNFERIVNEHFGFNIQLDTMVLGKYYDYVEQVIVQIIEEGEGVGAVPPPLGSHFMVYQQIINDLSQYSSQDQAQMALPVAWNPITAQREDQFHMTADELPPAGTENDLDTFATYRITNPVSLAAMNLFNQSYQLLIQMLSSFFDQYSIDQTTGIRPPQVNAFFQTAFYPFMTMVIRPLGELITRLPADANYVPVPGKVPPVTAGPNFLFAVAQGHGMGEEKRAITRASSDPGVIMAALRSMAAQARSIAAQCVQKNYHTANFQSVDARDFDVCFNYLAENFDRMALNFEGYWSGKMKFPIPSEGFQNFSDPFN